MHNIHNNLLITLTVPVLPSVAALDCHNIAKCRLNTTPTTQVGIQLDEAELDKLVLKAWQQYADQKRC